MTSIAVCFLATAPLHTFAQNTSDLTELSLEELANIRVTSVSKKSESIADAPASIFVITGNEIRRSGATTLPEALRLAPNLQVARSDARNYAVTARGFNGVFANKLLVLIDGRTVYTPLYSGVFWDAQDVVLEDIDRIEVISGPGGTLWGANAVNGVINVITKAAADTQGGLVAVGASSNEKNGALRYGGALANGGHYRVYGKYADNDDTRTAADAPVLTGWNRQQAGFRTDWNNANQRFTVQGDAYDGALHQQGTRDITIAGANLVGRMNTRLDGGSNVSLQAYWDFTERNQPNAFIEHLHTLDVQLQHSVQAAKNHYVVWGGGYRLAMDRVQNANTFAFLPESLNMHWGNVFVQDEIALRDDLKLTAGVKLENNNYTGTEVLPTLRLAWKPTESDLLWSSVSRAVRAPSRFDRDLFAPGIAGGPDFRSETADVVEVGYRAQPSSTVSFSATAFYSRYDQLRTLELNPGLAALTFSNGAEATARGIEMWGSWQPASAWRLSAGLVAQRIETESKPGRTDLTPVALAPNDPSNYWMLRSSYDIAQGQELDLTVRHNGKLRSPVVPAYTAVDLRYGWKIRRDLELSIVGQNLLDSSHPEFAAAPGRSEYERSVFVKLVWRQ